MRELKCASRKNFGIEKFLNSFKMKNFPIRDPSQKTHDPIF